MLKFFLGVVVGIALVIVVGFIGFVAIASLRAKPPAIAADSTLILHLEGDLPERSPVEVPLEILGQRTPLTMEEVWALLRRAATDRRIQAIVLEPSNLNVGWGKMQELHSDLEQFRKSGKPLYAYLKTPGTREYYVATAASRIYLGPEDMLNLKGLRFELTYFRHTLDKLGITVDVQHAGRYKDYGDMFTRSDMSPDTRQVLTSVIDRLYADLIKTIGTGRKKSVSEVEDAINNGPLLSPQVLNRGLVDELAYEDQMFGELRKDLKGEIHKIGEKEYAHNSAYDFTSNGRPRLAFVVAQGEILRGDPETASSASDSIESESFTRLLNRVENNSTIKGVIVRIDSPGGEVFPSDAIWRAMNTLAKKKPMVISMSDTAASGGYYMAMNGAPIVAYPGTLTGSIGVVFGKPNLHGLYDKVGVDKDMLTRGRFADIDSDYKPLEPAETAKLREGIDQNYRSFVQKVADARKRPFDEIEPVAQGRVWLGEQARENGLVDELGGIDRAIQLVKQKASIGPNESVTLVPYPAKRTLLEMLFSSQTPDAGITAQIAAAAQFHAAAPLAPLLKSPQIRAWIHGGYLSVSPWSLAIH